MRVQAAFVERGSILAGTKNGRCQGLEIEVVLDSDHDPLEIKEMLRLAHQMCFTEHALTHEMPIQVRHMLNGEPLELEGG